MANEFDMTANKGGGGGEKAPPGNHLAVLVGVFSMGTQENDFQGDVTRQRRAFFVWELVGATIAGTTKNHVIGIDLNLSLNEKAKLRKWIEARTGKAIPDGTPFNPATELGQPCLLNVVEKGGYPKIAGVAALPKGMPNPTPTYKPTLTTLDDFKANAGCIPEWCPWLYGSPLADHIRASIELAGDKPRPKKADGAPANADPIPY